MDIIEKIVTNSEAGKIQMNAAQFDCKVVGLGVLGGGNAKIKIEGTPENMQKLLDYVTEAGNNENKQTSTI